MIYRRYQATNSFPFPLNFRLPQSLSPSPYHHVTLETCNRDSSSLFVAFGTGIEKSRPPCLSYVCTNKKGDECAFFLVPFFSSFFHRCAVRADQGTSLNKHGNRNIGWIVHTQDAKLTPDTTTKEKNKEFHFQARQRFKCLYISVGTQHN